MPEISDSARAGAKVLADQMDAWLEGPAADSPEVIWCPAGPGCFQSVHYHHADSRLIEWCRSARDLLGHVAALGD